MIIQKGEINNMHDEGVIILIIVGLITSLQFVVRFIIDPFVKNKNGGKNKYSKIKILLSVFYCIFFLVLLFLDIQGFFEYK